MIEGVGEKESVIQGRILENVVAIELFQMDQADMDIDRFLPMSL